MRILGLFLLALSAFAQTAHLWVDTTGGTCTRNSTPATYSDAAACASFSDATTAATTGDTIRVKVGTYGGQSVGHATKVLEFIGEDGTTVDSGANQSQGLSFSGNVTVTNIDLAGDWPLASFSGANNTWRQSTFFEGRQERRCSPGDLEPILIYSDGATVSNTLLEDMVIEAQRGSPVNEGGCPANDPYHLEQIRIDQNVDGVTINRVTLNACPNGAGFVGCGSGQIFITTPTSVTTDPTNIVIKNTVFKGSPNYAVQVHANVSLANSTFAYNTYVPEPVNFDVNPTSVTFLGNSGGRPQNCTSGVTWTKNVWQWSTGTACGTDIRVQGDNFAIDQLLLDANLRPQSGSPVIGAAETSYCTSTLGSVDRDGNIRPVSSVCDAGAFEFGAVAATSSSFSGSGQIGGGSRVQ